MTDSKEKLLSLGWPILQGKLTQPMPSFYNCLFAFALLVNASFVWTAWMATPKAKLFPFKVLSKGRWLLNIVFLSSAFLSYWRPELVVTIVSLTLLSAARNASLIPLVRGLGEEAVLKLAVENASKEQFWSGLLFRILPALCYGFLALFIFFFFSAPDTWGFWIALGVASHSAVLLLAETLGYLKHRKLGGAASKAN
jgi:hypothetical protein